MSDCFDHAADAYDDLCFGRTSDGDNNSYFSKDNWQALGRSCNICGTRDLHWLTRKGRWRLCTNKGAVHECHPKDEFVVI